MVKHTDTATKLVQKIETDMRYILMDEHATVKIIYMSNNGWIIDCDGVYPNLASDTLANMFYKVRAWQNEIQKRRNYKDTIGE